MNTTIASGTLRIVTALVVVTGVAAAGYGHRSPWVLTLFAPVLTVLYALGKWTAWRYAWRQGGLRQILAAFALTLPIQLVLAAILYLIGYGLGSLLGQGERVIGLEAFDFALALGLLAFGAVVTVLINRLEAPRTSVYQAATDFPLEVDPTPLTVGTFFVGPHYTHKDYTDPAAAADDTIPAAAITRPGMIEAAEARLGVRLPQRLRELYQYQNGGHVGSLWVALKDDPRPLLDDWRGAFSHDYCDLLPLEELRTLYDCYLDFTDPEDAAAMAEIPLNAKSIVVLTKRYLDTTFLDYSAPGEPRVGIVDFEQPDDSPEHVYFDNFDSFFAALRRERDSSPK